MQKVCFTLKLKKERMEDYLKAHRVWPEMLQAISDTAISNYSLFIDKNEAIAVGYFEAENTHASLEKLGQTEVNRRWQDSMAEFFESSSGDLESGGLQWLAQYFHLA